jgi:hypothetical protein
MPTLKARPSGQRHHARADAEGAVVLPVQVAEAQQRVAKAVHAALGQLELAGQPRQAHRLTLLRQPLEQRQRARHRRHQSRRQAGARARSGIEGAKLHAGSCVFGSMG